MIKFKRVNKNIELWFEHGIIPGSGHVFTGSCTEANIAQALTDRFTHELEKALSNKIEQAYLEGCKDTRQHKKKKTKFIGTFDIQIW